MPNEDGGTGPMGEVTRPPDHDDQRALVATVEADDQDSKDHATGGVPRNRQAVWTMAVQGAILFASGRGGYRRAPDETEIAFAEIRERSSFEVSMARRRIDTEMLEGVSIEWLDGESFDTALAAWSDRKYLRQRKCTPLDRLLPHTLLWAAELPPQVVPLVLMKHYPRIANLVAANWKEQTAFHNYMRALLVDRRGNRQGFPSEIKEELIRLRTYYYLGDIYPSAVAETLANASSAAGIDRQAR